MLPPSGRQKTQEKAKERPEGGGFYGPIRPDRNATQGVTITPSDLPHLMLSAMAGRATVMWRDRKVGYVEIDPQAALQTVLAERESKYDAEAAKWAEIEAAGSAGDLPPLPERPKRKPPVEQPTASAGPSAD